MKKEKRIVVFAIGLILLFCFTACEADTSMGTLSIKLPGSNPRSVSPDFIETLSFRIDCESAVYGSITRSADSGGIVSISLAAGSWTIKITVFNVFGDKIGERTFTADIIGGSTTEIPDVDVEIDTHLNDIKHFEITSPVNSVGVINEVNRIITVNVPLGIEINSMMFNVIHTGVRIDPAPGGPLNFSSESGVEFTVTAENGDPKTYTVIVTGAYLPSETSKDIIIFSITNPYAIGTITNENISVTVPFGTDLSLLEFDIYHNGDYVEPDEGRLDFSTPKTFTVTAENRSTKTYTVTVRHSLSPIKELNDFYITSPVPVIGNIDGTNVQLHVPFATDVTSVIFGINYTGASIEPDPADGALDLSTPKPITVTALDGSTKTWTITVTFGERPIIGGGTTDEPFQIFNETDLRKVGTGVDGFEINASYILMDDITLTAPSVAGTSNWTPIGTNTTRFTGTFNGNDKVISNMEIISDTGNKGMFAYIGADGTVKNLGLENITISINTNSDNVGGIAAYNYGMIDNCYVTGIVVSSGGYVGGLVGRNLNNRASVQNSHFIGHIFSYNTGHVGGLVGRSENDTIKDSYAEGTVSGTQNIGGLVGYNTSSTVQDCYTTGNVSGANTSTGGLIGLNNHSSVQRCYTSGSVNGTRQVGGVVGRNNRDRTSSAIVEYCYATGNVSGTDNNVGGVVGINNLESPTNNPWFNGEVQNCFAMGNVSGANFVGGVLGHNATTNANTFRNSVALNPNVNRTGTISPIRLGRVNGGTGAMSNNYARDDMVINKIPLEVGANLADGESIPKWDAPFWASLGFLGAWWTDRLPIKE